jgi:hypothetical protein
MQAEFADEVVAKPSLWRRWGWAISIAAGLVAPSVLVLAFTLDGAGYPGIGIREPTLTALGVVLVAWLFFQLVAVVGWMGKQLAGRWPAVALLLGMGVLLGLIPAVMVGFVGKLMVAEILSERAKPVIAAIEAFHNARGFWPADIEQLVPEYLPDVPRTGSPIYPDFILRTDHWAEEFGNPWVLEVPMNEILKFDALYYCPQADCEEQVREIGGTTTRVGSWIFLNE